MMRHTPNAARPNPGSLFLDGATRHRACDRRVDDIRGWRPRANRCMPERAYVAHLTLGRQGLSFRCSLRPTAYRGDLMIGPVTAADVTTGIESTFVTPAVVEVTEPRQPRRDIGGAT